MADHEMPADDHRDDEFLADVPAQPVADEANSWGSCLFSGVMLTGVAGVGSLFLVSAMITPTHGATRSSKLQWEQRQLEIEQAAEDAQSDSNDQC